MTAAAVLEARPSGAPAAGAFEGKRLRLVRLESFEPAAYIAPEHRAAYDRRFVTLLLDEGSLRRGGVGEVIRAVSPRGERFALKRLRAMGVGDGDSGSAAALRASFDAEYDAHRALASLRGFPRLFGRGRVEGDPVIVMEWVEGVTLETAARALAVDGAGRLSPLVAARIGRDLFDLLARMAYLDGGLAHRDVSLRNVMVDTSRLSVADQVEEGSFQLVLIDFGSAAPLQDGDSSLTARYGAACGATADYAPPEMLTEDVAGMDGLRHSPAVDVYAAAGVLYALLEGRPPYDLSFEARDRCGGLSAFRMKTEFSPEPPAGAHGAATDVRAVLAAEPEVAVAVGRAVAELTDAPSPHGIRLALATVDGQLDALLAACLAPVAARRPSPAAMRDALALFCSQYADNVARALKGEPLAPCPLGPAAAATRRGRRLRRGARMTARALSAAVAVGVAVSVGVLVQGMSVTFPANEPWWTGPLPGAVAAAALLLPFVGALAARGRAVPTTLGLVAGALGALLGAALAGLLTALTAWPTPAVEQALYGALFLATAAPLPLLVADRALTPAGAAVPVAPAPSRPVLPWIASSAAAGAPPSNIGGEGAGSTAAALPDASSVAAGDEAEAAYEVVDEMSEELA